MDQYQRGQLTFDVRDGGPPDGDIVLLLHGFPQDATSWSSVEPALHAAGLRTLAPDQRGYSPGARPVQRKAYVMSELTADIVSLMDAAGASSAHVVGHDWGGAVAWALAGDHPDRVRSLTSLSTPHPAALTKSWTSSTQALKSWYMLAFQLPWLPEHLLPRGLATGLERGGLSKESAQHSAERLGTPEAFRGAVNWYRGLPFSLRAKPHRTRVPTTYVWGKHDEYLGRTAAELTRNFVSADYRFVELDAGHWLPETHAEEVSASILERVRSVQE